MFFGLSALGAKLVFVALGLTTTAFVISTIVVAVEKADLQDDLDACRNELLISTTTTTTTVATTSSSSTASVTTPPTTATPEVTETTPAPEIDYRLPGNIIPDVYDLHLNPNLESGEFTGQQTITINVLEATNEIILHSNGLTILEVAVAEGPGESLEHANKLEVIFKLDTVREFLIVFVRETLKKDEVYTLDVKFEGVMLGKIVGLYSSSYSKPDGSKK
ncbi:unnamed protein product [Hermetia illucens]|nr:unnamed protein product [Hermetia illucens]